METSVKDVYLLLDETGRVIALYDDADIALKMKKPIEDKLQVILSIEKRTVNLELSVIGVFK